MHKKAGYSLIEVMVALFLVATGTIAFGAMVPMASRSARMNANYQQAVSLAQHKVDQCRAVGWGRLTYTELQAAGIIDASPTTSPYRFDGVDQLDGTGGVFPDATGTLTVTDFSSTVRQVTATIVWTGTPVRQGSGSLEVVALIAKG
jgi:prepilin-type N-terminal cleavage/methylation domain-containing protein